MLTRLRSQIAVNINTIVCGSIRYEEFHWDQKSTTMERWEKEQNSSNSKGGDHDSPLIFAHITPQRSICLLFSILISLSLSSPHSFLLSIFPPLKGIGIIVECSRRLFKTLSSLFVHIYYISHIRSSQICHHESSINIAALQWPVLRPIFVSFIFSPHSYSTI